MNQLYQRDPQSYIKAIADKLDRLQKADPNSKSKQHHQVNPMNDPGYMDPMEWQGRAAQEFMRRNNQINS
jgi:hypothetical protein